MTQQRLSLSSMIAAAAAVAALGLPGMASAAYEHPANNETGVIVHPEHFKSEKTRAQVIAETKAAMQQGRLSYGESNYPIGKPTPDAGSGKTRAQVIAETKAAMQQGRLSYGESNYPIGTPTPDAGSGKTRAQVINELQNESPAERNARLRFYSRG